MKALDVQKYELEITSDCNAECPLCSRTLFKMPLRGNDNLTLEDIKKIFQDTSLVKNRIFKLCGVLGDPIINPECLEICEWLSTNGAKKIEISTNAGYNNAEWWKRLAKIKNVVVCFSVDGMEHTNHIYRVNVKWNTVERNMRAFREAGGKGQWVYIVFSHNEDEYEKARVLAKEIGLEFVKRTAGRNILHGRKHQSRKMEKEVFVTASKKFVHSDTNLSELKWQKSEKSSASEIQDLKERAETITCKHLYEPELYIGANMTLWPCCYLYSEHLVPGRGKRVLNVDYEQISLSKHTIDEILANKFFKTIKERWYADHTDYQQRCMKNCSMKQAYANRKEVVDKNK